MGELNGTEVSIDLNLELENINTRVRELERELSEIDINIPSIKERAALKKIRKELLELNTRKEEIEHILEDINQVHSEIKNLENLLSETKDNGARYVIEKDLKILKSKEAVLLNNLNSKKAPSKNKRNFFTKKKVSVVALLIAGATMFGLSKGCMDDKKETESSNKNSVSNTYEVPNIPNIDIPNIKIEDKDAFTDIFDEEQVHNRASELLEYFNDFIPYYGITIEDVKDYLCYINGGVVNEVSRESALEVIKTIEVLMNKEINYSVDMINKGESDYAENNKIIDYSKFYLDGSEGQKLAKKITDIRSGLILNHSSSDNIEYATKYANLLMNSWYLNGHEEISVYALETSGMKALTDKLFLNTAMLTGAVQHDLQVYDPLEDEMITLEFIIGEVNNANCKIELIADKGGIVPKYVNKFTSDWEGMIKEAAFNKLAYEKNFLKKLLK